MEYAIVSWQYPWQEWIYLQHFVDLVSCLYETTSLELGTWGKKSLFSYCAIKKKWPLGRLTPCFVNVLFSLLCYTIIWAPIILLTITHWISHLVPIYFVEMACWRKTWPWKASKALAKRITLKANGHEKARFLEMELVSQIISQV